MCVGDVVQMPNAVGPEVYFKCFEVFRLVEYADRFAELVGDRRCRHCRKPLPTTASEPRLYCDAKCSQANPQRRHRIREKEAILRRRDGDSPYRERLMTSRSSSRTRRAALILHVAVLKRRPATFGPW